MKNVLWIMFSTIVIIAVIFGVIFLCRTVRSVLWEMEQEEVKRAKWQNEWKKSQGLAMPLKEKEKHK